jgi:hypothetical protein
MSVQRGSIQRQCRIAALGIITAVGLCGCHRAPQNAAETKPEANPTSNSDTPADANAHYHAKSAEQWPGFAEFPGPIITGHPIERKDLTESELHFGVAPQRGPGVVYQDDIVLMEHGDKAIRSFASDGMSWTLDANAPQVSDIQVGKILFATGRCVGRVLAMQRNGDTVSVVLGPVQLTDLIKKGNFSYDQPLDLNSLIAYATPDYPGSRDVEEFQKTQSATPTTQQGGSGFRVRHVDYFVVSERGEWRPMPTAYHQDFRVTTYADLQIPGQLTPGIIGLPNLRNFGNVPGPLPGTGMPDVKFGNGSMSATPCGLSCGGIGLMLSAEKNGTFVKLYVVLHLATPHFVFRAAIQDGKMDAEIALYGAAGVSVSFDAAAKTDFKGNINAVNIIPVELTVPIGGMFVPLSVKLSQAISLNSAFSAKTSTLHAEGELGVFGALAARYYNGKWEIDKPDVRLKKNLAGLISGVSVGINSLVFAIDQRLMVGVSVAGFSTGPYTDAYSTLTALNQSSIARACTQGTFNLQLGAGIGYSMPKVVASIINAVLSLFGAKPVPAWGSIVSLPKRVPLIDHLDQLPEGCAGK